ncbi:PA3496 family putative envelope integrity protein [Pseudomonas sp. LRF_L74]|uniref:PA3496 family putative envelope integrity protein n=1 Tax=Pseudomonas sp. LRF_L74 TaxID=3369422 RepID=UPI003F622BA0
MSTGKEELDLEEDFVAEDTEDNNERPVEVAKTNLTKRRIIDNYLDERRLQKQLGDYDYDL